jgi:type I restriction-modification system DNA methylase subunit
MSIFSPYAYKTNPTIFSRKRLEKDAREYRIDTILNIEDKKKKLAGWIKGIQDGSVTSKKEEAIDHDFLNLFFGEILDYEYRQGIEQINLEKQLKNQTDSKKADGALGYFNTLTGEKIVKAVIELKDGQTDLDKPQNRKNDHRTPVQQAFDYASDAGGTCNWVIVSNFVEIRLYNYRDRGKYELFYISELLENEIELKRFFYLFYKTQLISKFETSPVDRKYDERQVEQLSITNKFYNQYKQLRVELLTNLRELNPEKDPLWLLEKTQKLLDRIVFICFCEDTVPELIPEDTIKKMVDSWRKDKFQDANALLWLLTKGLFASMDQGNDKAEIQPFNGGLFATDSALDALNINSFVLVKALNLSDYDFESELNVNILGHIFEQSISDIEELQKQIANQAENGEPNSKLQDKKRKKDGVFYTPEYITKYMVEETIGLWLENQKAALGFENLTELTTEDYDLLLNYKSLKTAQKKEIDEKLRPHREFWLAFKAKLDNVTVLDPACGSGAFLIQVFDFLYNEQKLVSNELARIFPEFKTDWWEVQRQILMKNLYGVDLNFESVEITKLSLWIKTANNAKPLSFIDKNIQCGNSLIDEPEIAGNKAFHWENKFPQIFEKGGFDIVIANPPWGAEMKEKDWLKHKYKESSFGEINSYKYFIQKGIQLLNNEGCLSFIQPDSYLEKEYFADVRIMIAQNASQIKNVKLGDNIFEEVNLPCSILILNHKIKAQKEFRYTDLSKEPLGKKKESLLKRNYIAQSLIPDYKSSFVVKKCYFRKKPYILLDNLFEQVMGVKVYQVGKGMPKQTNYEVDNDVFVSKIQKDKNHYKFISQGINRYYYEEQGEFINYGAWLAEPRDIKYFNQPKIVVREVINSYLYCTFIEEEAVVKNIAGVIINKDENYSLKYLLSLLNSKLFAYCIKNETPKSENKAFPSINSRLLKTLPIQELSKENQQPFIEKADKMLSMQKELNQETNAFLEIFSQSFVLKKTTTKLKNWHENDFFAFQTELAKQKIDIPVRKLREWLDLFKESQAKIKTLEQKIAQTDSELNQMVYQLYDLTAVEIAVVEGK